MKRHREDEASSPPDRLQEDAGTEEISPLEVLAPPGNREVRPGNGVIPTSRNRVTHGWHSQDAVQIPTSLTCNLCPLYHVRRKDRRHPLACPEAKKHQVCPILTGLQERWAEALICEVQEATGSDPRPSDNARIEQVIRHRSRIFQIENYLKVAGLIDLNTGTMRNVADRLTTTENALSRALAELRQAIADRSGGQQDEAPRLDEYLKSLRNGGGG